MGHYDKFEEEKIQALYTALAEESNTANPRGELQGLCAPAPEQVMCTGSVSNTTIPSYTALLSINIHGYTTPFEMLDFINVMRQSAESRKYEDENYLKPNGRKCSVKQMHKSMMNHLVASILEERTDSESGLDPLLHLAARALMMYTRIKRGINHDED